MGLEKVPPILKAKLPDVDLNNAAHRESFMAMMRYFSAMHGGGGGKGGASNPHAGGMSEESLWRMYEGESRCCVVAGLLLLLGVWMDGVRVAKATSSSFSSNSSTPFLHTTTHPPTNHPTHQTAQTLWDEYMAESASNYIRSAGAGSRMVVMAGSNHIQNRYGVPDRITRRLGVPVFTVVPISVAFDAVSGLPAIDEDGIRDLLRPSYADWLFFVEDVKDANTGSGGISREA